VVAVAADEGGGDPLGEQVGGVAVRGLGTLRRRDRDGPVIDSPRAMVMTSRSPAVNRRITVFEDQFGLGLLGEPQGLACPAGGAGAGTGPVLSAVARRAPAAAVTGVLKPTSEVSAVAGSNRGRTRP
jgi:hypothetical protein